MNETKQTLVTQQSKAPEKKQVKVKVDYDRLFARAEERSIPMTALSSCICKCKSYFSTAANQKSKVALDDVHMIEHILGFEQDDLVIYEVEEVSVEQKADNLDKLMREMRAMQMKYEQSIKTLNGGIVSILEHIDKMNESAEAAFNKCGESNTTFARIQALIENISTELGRMSMGDAVDEYDKCKRFIKNSLHKGEAERNTIVRQAVAAGISEDVIEKVKTDLCVKVKTKYNNGVQAVFWRL